MPDRVDIRLLAARDSMAVLTALLHRAYAPLARQGMNFAAAMKEEVTRSIDHSKSVSASAVEEARKQVTARGRDQQG